MVAIACSFAASTPIQARVARSNSASARSEDEARLVVSRAANFGTFQYLILFVDGVRVADLGIGQSYDAVLPPGHHVHRSIGVQRRLNDASTWNPARPTHLPRSGKTLTGLTSIGTAAPRESSHRATLAKRRKPMSSTDDAPSSCTRRRFLTLSIASGASASLLLSLSSPVS
jgi:hypothetical protein